MKANLYHYCDNCGAFKQAIPPKRIQDIMKQQNVLTWTISKVCKRCRSIKED